MDEVAHRRSLDWMGPRIQAARRTNRSRRPRRRRWNSNSSDCQWFMSAACAEHGRTCETLGMTVIASGRTVEADSWQLRVSTEPGTGDLTSVVDIQLADGSTVWGGGCRGAVPPSTRLNTYFGAADTGPRIFIGRVTSDVRAVVVTLSDGTREDLVLHSLDDAPGLSIGVLVYPRGLDIHRVDLVGHAGEPLSPEA